MNEKELFEIWLKWRCQVDSDALILASTNPTDEQWGSLVQHLGLYMRMRNRYCPRSLKTYLDRYVGEPPEWLTREVGDWESDHEITLQDLTVIIYQAIFYTTR